MRIIQLTSYPNPNELGLGNTNETYIRIESSLNVSDIFPPDIDVQIEDANTHKKYVVKAKEGNEFRINKLGQLYRDYNVNPGDEIKFTYIEIQDQKTIFFTVKNYKRVFLKVGSKGTEIVNMDNIAPFMVDEEKQEYSIKIDEGVLLLKFLKSDKKRVDSPNETNYFSSHINNVQLSDGDYFITLNDNRNILEVVKKNVVEEYTLLEDSQYKIPNQSSNKLSHQQIFYSDLSTFDKRLLTAMRTKPFLLLAGISGTGKSRIVRELARACWDVGTPEYEAHKPKNFEMIQVKPNWHDSTELIGYVSRVSGTPTYIIGDFLRFITRAWENLEVPHFLCLDEMNLAPVEQYFAEFLSVIESRKSDGNGIVRTDPILKKSTEDWYRVLTAELTGKNEALRNQFLQEGITIPQNLIVVGTVNMDETTFSFSRKVLDRAMTIEMNEVDLYAGLQNKYERIGKLTGDMLIGTAVEGVDVYLNNQDVCDKALTYLEAVNNVLNNTPFKVAYRVRNEFLLYVVNSLPYNKDDDGNDVPENMVIARALDEITNMKILSRIEGDDTKVKGTLLQGLMDTIEKQLLALTGEDEKIESVSIAKLKEMQERLESGYTSFWS